jgi:long-chain acyl-CoA synthetase
MATAAAERTLHGWFREVARAHPDAVAISFAGRTTTFAALDAASDRVAAWMAARGVAKGDRIGLYCPNSDAFAVAYFGILKAGAVVLPINLLLNPKEVAWILDDAGATGLVFHEAFAGAVEATGFQVSSSRFQVRIGTGAGGRRRGARSSRAKPRARSPPWRRPTTSRCCSTRPGRRATPRARC